MTRDDDTTSDGIDLSRRDFTKALGAASIAAVGAGAGTGTAAGAEPIVSVGSGAYLDRTLTPSSGGTPPNPQYTTDNVSTPIPTSDWWSRLLTIAQSNRGGSPGEPLYLHSQPLYTEPTTGGLEIGYTDEWEIGSGTGVDLANESDVDGNSVEPYAGMNDTVYMPREADFTIGHTATSAFDQSLVDGYGDWHVTYKMGSADPSMTVTQVQGSPYLYLNYAGGGAELSFDAAPTVFEEDGNALGVTIDGNHYGLFGPTGSSWSGTGSSTLTNDLGSAGYVTIALLPDDSTSTFDTFAQYAHHHVVDTQIDWEYVSKEGGEVVSEVRTTFEYTVDDRTGSGGTGTLTALYPHQHKYLADGESVRSGMTYESPRGTMKVTSGGSFTTALKYPGILPNYPIVGEAQSNGVNSDLERRANVASLPDPNQTGSNFSQDWADTYNIPTASDAGINYATRLGFIDGKEQPYGGSYWTGLNMNRWSEAAGLLDEAADVMDPLADTGSWSGRRDSVLAKLSQTLEWWFTPEGSGSVAADTLDQNLFFYDDNWGTLVPEVGGFGVYSELNDHAFHLGYFVRGASEVARHQPDWATTSNWGGMVNMLIRDYASPSRNDDMFPFLRNFSPFAGRSYASGVNPFGLGNNQEASSEAVNAYSGMIRWGEFTGQEIDGTSIRDLGIFLYTHEIHAALEYWYDWDQENHPDNWEREYASVVWDDGYSHSTWWTEDNEDAYAINVVPANGDSLYLGWDEDHTQTVYDELVDLKGDDQFTKWKGVLLEFGAFAASADTKAIFEDWESGNFPATSNGYYVPDMHNSKLHTYTTLTALNDLGSPTREIVSDTTFSHVLVDDTGQKNYIVNNPEGSATIVTFSDGCTFEVPADTTTVQRGITGIDDPSAPTTPSGLESTSVSDTTVTLDWSAASDAESGVSSYQIYKDGSQYTTADTPGTTVTGLASATAHTFSVSAVNGAGVESSKSSSIDVATKANAEDYTLSVDEPTPGEVTVSFTPTAASDSAQLTYSVDGGSESTVRLSEGDGGTWTATLSGLSQNAEITHYVTFDRAGNSYETKTATYTVVGSDTTAPTVPGGVSASTVTPRTLELTWEAASDTSTAVAEYVVYEGGSERTRVAGTATTITGLTPATTYEFSVSAVDRAGNESTTSERVGVTTEADPLADLDGTEWERVWGDEFGDSTVDSATWGYDTGGGCGPSGQYGSCSWGNNESQYYTDGDNARIENGSLVITAREESPSGSPNPYTSARVKSQGKKSVQYGRIDVRATLPKGQGIWPAIWMLGSNIGDVGWPDCGEIDIMELLGDKPSEVHGTVHGPGYSAGNSIGGSYTLDNGSFAESPHTFSIVWEEDQIKWFVDGNQYHSVTRTEVENAGNEWVFDDSEFFFIFNIAVGGQWPGYPDSTTTFPQEMRIDHIRQYEPVAEDTTAPSAPTGLSTANATQSAIDLSWSAATDNVGVDQYVVTVDGEEFTTASGTSVTIDGLSADTSYEFGVKSVDAAGNTSSVATTTGQTAAPPSEQTLTVSFPDGNTVTEDGTVEAALTLTSAPDGLAGFDVDVTVENAGIATITGASVSDTFSSDFQSVSINSDGTSVNLQGSDANNAIESGATDVQFATITITPSSVGETNVGLVVGQVDADGGALIEPTLKTATLVVEEGMLPIGDNPAPTDPDDDGLYEDVNGNGEFDANDVVVLFNHRESSNVTDQIEHFDFNQNERSTLDFDDINALFEEY